MVRPLTFRAHINKPGAITQFMTTGLLPRVGDPLRPIYGLDLLHKPLDLGPCQIEQYWIDRSKIYPTRNRFAAMYQPITDAYWDLCELESTDQDLDVQESFLLASLLPDIRDQKAREVFRDSVPSRRYETQEYAEAAADLEDMLSRDKQAMSVPDLHRFTAEVLGPPIYDDEIGELYDQMAEQLLAPARELLPHSKDEAVSEMRTRWGDWLIKIGRRHGKEREKQVLDILSHECKAAFHRAYSLVWNEMILVLQREGWLDLNGARFHRFWHRVRKQTSQAFPNHCAYLFHGHVFGLHPAAAIFIQTQTGKRLIGEWLVDDSQDRFESLLGGLRLAICHYKVVQDDRRDNRRVMVPKALRDG